MALTPAKFIREHVLDMSQKELAVELNVSQPRISKLESFRTGGKVPKKHRSKFKELAEKVGKKIPDSWFSKVPIRGA